MAFLALLLQFFINISFHLYYSMISTLKQMAEAIPPSNDIPERKRKPRPIKVSLGGSRL